MRKHHQKNERIKHRYCSYQEEAMHLSSTSVDAALAAIVLFEASTGYRDFSSFNIEQARRFKRLLKEETSHQTGKPLAIATIRARLMAVKTFFQWLSEQAGYKSGVCRSDCEYFNLSANDTRIATARRPRPFPTLDQVQMVLANMAHASDIEKRDRAVIAFALLSGARDDALASLKIKHVDCGRKAIFQDARTVRTKFRKSFETTFFPVGESVETIAVEWTQHLTKVLGFGPDDPLFPTTEIGLDAKGGFSPIGLMRQHWSNADAIRRIFKTAFEAAGLLYFHPHSLRKTLTQLGEQICPDIEAMKAWSQNFGHETLSTTLTSYGKVSSERQSEILLSLKTGQNKCADLSGDPNPETVSWVVNFLNRQAASR